MTKTYRTLSRTILLENYVLPFRIGIHDFELETTQNVAIDIKLTLSDSVNPGGDDIDTTVDYDFLRQEISELSRNRHFNLQETLCEAVTDICFSHPLVREATVRTRKVDVYPDCDAVSFEMSCVR